jgi:hypothetical protein
VLRFLALAALCGFPTPLVAETARMSVPIQAGRLHDAAPLEDEPRRVVMLLARSGGALGASVQLLPRQIALVA